LNRQQMLNDYTEKFIIHRSMWEAEWNRTNSTGFSSRQALMLMILNNSGPQQAKELMGKLAISSGGVTVMSDNLIKRGLIQRNKNEQDRRGIFLELTDQGREFYLTIARDWNVVMNKIFGVLSDVEVAILRELFAKLDEANS
jgi:DNA-binding MarR family transcriptional regulator